MQVKSPSIGGGNKNPSTGGNWPAPGLLRDARVHPASDHKNTMDGNFEEKMMTQRFLDGFFKVDSSPGL